MGYVHRDLKPDNIMLNFKPLRVVVIDFNRAVRKENIKQSWVLGTPGYFPIREKWINGSFQWDIWALAAIILECDLEKDAYFRTKEEKQTKAYAKLHFDNEDVCKHLKELISKIIIKAPMRPNFELDELESAVSKIEFRAYETDRTIKFA